MAKNILAKGLPISKETLLLSLSLLGLTALMALVTFLGPQNKPGTEALVENSIYNTGPSGYRAWFLTVEKAGLPIVPWERSFDNLDELPTPTTMLVVKPYTVVNTHVAFDEKEAAKLLKWVGKGNTLVLLDDFQRFGSNTLLRRLQLAVEAPPTPKNTKNNLTDRQKSPTASPKIVDISANAPKRMITYIKAPLLTGKSNTLRSTPTSLLTPEPILLNTQGKSPLILAPYRKGRLILGTVTDLGENQYLNQPANDNYQFLSNLLKQTNNPVVINEFVHGYLENDDLITYFQKKTPLGGIFAQLVFLFCLLLWLSFVRWQPPRKPEDSAEKYEEEGATQNNGAQTPYIQSLAGLYLRSKSAALALSPQLRQLKTTLKQRHQIDLSEEGRVHDLLMNLFANYSNTQDSPAELMETVRLAVKTTENNLPLPPQALIKTSRQLTLIEERLQYGHRKQHDRQ